MLRILLEDTLISCFYFTQVGRLTNGYWSKWKKSILAFNTGFPKSHLQSSCVELTVHFLIHFSHSFVSDSLQPHGLQHTRSPCPSPTPRVYPNSCPLSQWCHPTFSFSTIPFSSCPQSFPSSGSFQMSQFFASGGQSIGVSASISVLPMKIQDWLPLAWTGWISYWNNVIKVGHKIQVRLGCSMCGVIGSFDHPWLLLSSVIRCRQRKYRRDMECDLVPAHSQLSW